MNAARIALALLLVAAIVGAPGWSSVPAGWIALFLTLRAVDDHFITRDAKTWGLIHRAAAAGIVMTGAWVSAVALIVAIFTSSFPAWVGAVYGFAAAWALVPPIFVSVVFLLAGLAQRFSGPRTRSRHGPNDPRAISMPIVTRTVPPPETSD
jgi:hypothetical protein